ncbi:SMP-30/gluconolactonase/LRE family protein [Rahnella sp. PCH160]|uniref:SMP-30/gluconolactonase/LRE family protein n=1 Tax=Rahnella sp. PCH160 TaxID=3447928 RepID=UPI0039FDD575
MCLDDFHQIAVFRGNEAGKIASTRPVFTATICVTRLVEANVNVLPGKFSLTTTIAPYGETVAYPFNSPAPDSMKADSDGNLYIALHGQGRVIVLNRNAIPIGQITIPGRDEGNYLRTTNLAIKQGERDVYITASSDMNNKNGSGIFKVSGFANGL